jgi:hypothetical protein
LQGQPLASLVQPLSGVAKIVQSVTIKDLVAEESRASTGVYFFFEDLALMYVGKSSSRALIERIPSHFDIRPGCYFGTLLRKLADESEPHKQPVQCVDRALGMRLALLVADSTHMPDDHVKELVTDTENALRSLLLPKLNSPRNPKSISPSEPLGTIY